MGLEIVAIASLFESVLALLLMLLKVELALGKLKVTCFALGDFCSLTPFKIGTMVVVIGDVLTVVIVVCEFNEV